MVPQRRKNTSRSPAKYFAPAPLPMPIAELDDNYDDENWDDDESDDPGDDVSAPCPECGEPIHVITGKCPACGYWMTAADRQTMYRGERKPLWLKVTAIVLLMALLAGVLGIVVRVF